MSKKVSGKLVPINKGGRVERVLDKKDKEKIEALLQLQCTQAEIAQEFGMCTNTFKRCLRQLYKDDPTVKKPVCFTTVYEAYHVKGYTSLRSQMFKTAMAGNVAMQIFLAKNWLGMSDDPIPVADNSEAIDFAKAMKASVDSFAHDIDGTAELVEESNIVEHKVDE